jgi:ADP-ribose pyrophosphatase YjhB (NUDIX family)
MSYFNIRVYGLLLNQQGELLISDEFAHGAYFTKFPGGGLEIGEGLIDALKREFMEECQLEIEVLEHFYTTDFYEKSSFNDSQVVSIYYFVKALSPINLTIKTEPFDLAVGEVQAFRWKTIAELQADDFTFRTEKTVLELLKK